MKNFMLLASFLLLGITFGQSKSEEKNIADAVRIFTSAGDQQDVSRLKNILHESYRLVWNSGKDAPFIAGKAVFLGKFEQREWGGDQRDVTIESIQVFDDINAVAKVISDGKKAQMRSLFSLVKVDGEWKIIGELVNATFKG